MHFSHFSDSVSKLHSKMKSICTKYESRIVFPNIDTKMAHIPLGLSLEIASG